MNKVMKGLKMSTGKNPDTMNVALKKWLIKNNSRLCVVTRPTFPFMQDNPFIG